MGVLERKIRREVGLASEPGFPVMGQTHYLNWLAAAHGAFRPNVYLEIGTETGVSLAMAECESFAVDPAFRVTEAVVGKKPELHMYRGTSDAFFEEDLLGKLQRRVDFAFLDGLHLFEFLLRDFINTEANVSGNAVIVMHDCVPFGHLMADRKWDKDATKFWTGDVWKILPILRRFRPELEVRVIDAAPTGLVIVRGLDPKNTVLRANYDQIIQEFTTLTLSEFGLEELGRVVDLQNADEKIVSHKRKAAKVAVKRSTNPLIAIKICAPSQAKQLRWGDYFFALGLKRGFEALGLASRIDPWSAWSAAPGAHEVDLFLSGTVRYTPNPDRPCLFWLVYPKKAFDPKSMAEFAHVFVAAQAYRDVLASNYGQPGATVLEQGFDSTLMRPTKAARSDNVVYVANNHSLDQRPMMEWSLKGGQDIKVWGKGWEGEAARHVVNSFLPNEELPALYSTAAAVLCDHHGKMRDWGFLSNRIYDALACGAPVIVDIDPDMVPEEFRPFVYFAQDAATLDQAIKSARAETAERRDARRAFALTLVQNHSFEARAVAIAGVLSSLGLVKNLDARISEKGA